MSGLLATAPGRARLAGVNPLARSLLRDLAGYWPLDEASGTRRDLSGRALTLTDSNSPLAAAGPSSKLPVAGQFVAASNQFLSRASSALLQGGAISQTWAAWGYLESVGADRFLVSKQDGVGVGGNREYNLCYVTTSDRFVAQVWASDGVTIVGTVTANSFGAPPLTTWLYLMAWVDIVANTINIQVNNGPVDSAALTGTPGVTAGQFILGALASTNRQWDGRIAGVAYWKRALSSAERAYMAQGRVLVPGRGFV